MKVTVGIVGLLATSASCLRVTGPPGTLTHSAIRTTATSAAAATTTTTTAASKVARAVVGRTAVLRQAALGKVHRVARGGGGEGEGTEGVLSRAAALPLLQFLPPQVGLLVVCWRNRLRMGTVIRQTHTYK